MSIPDTMGSLTLVSVPIGNLGDTTVRAIEVLRTAHAIACEDTRSTGKLLNKLGIERTSPLLSYRQENEQPMALALVERIERGEQLALVSDAGTPAISDPGFRLVRECRRRGLPVTASPGVSAVVAALSLSGLPSDGFFYAGFLPPKRSARRRFFEEYADFPFTIVLYESCHRIGKFLDDLVEVFGTQRCISVSRELTKLHETVRSGPSGEVRESVVQGSQKGEFVICIAKQGYAL